MALSATVDTSGVSMAPFPEPVSGPGHNDAFSFWKLPQDWKASLDSSIAESRLMAEHYLLEGYLSREDRQPPSRMQAYYRVKNLIPAALRHRLNSAAIKMRAKREFPRWPCESALVDYWSDWLRISLHALNETDAWHIGFWPDGMNCSIVLTHDVEGPLGMSRMERMADLEERYNFRSSWNLPLAQYEIDWKLIDRLRDRGFEFGAHGLSHSKPQRDRFQGVGSYAPGAGAPTRYGWLPRAFDVAPRRMDNQALVRFRLQLFGFRSLRASTGRNLQRVSFLPRAYGRVALHDAAGSHPDSSVTSQSDGDLGNEGEVDRVARRDDSDASPS